jgi:transmembrane sensor
MITLSDDLWQDLRKAQDEALDGSRHVAQTRELMPLRAPARPRRKSRAWMMAAIVTFGVLAVGGVGVWQRGIKSLTFAVGESAREPGQVGAWIAAPPRSRWPLRFSDGSEVALQAGSRLRVAELSPDGAHVVLERGRALVHVVHRATSRWRLDVGPFEVGVVGTRFELDWDPRTEVLRVALEEGAVRVKGAFLRQPVTVTQGQTLVASTNDKRAELMESGPARAMADASVTPSLSEPDSVTEAEPLESTKNAEPGEPRVPSTINSPLHKSEVPSWQKLATSGKFADALDAVERQGFDAECRRASGQDLMLLGDTARLSGRTAWARKAYLSARDKLPSGDRTAYGLGLLAFDQQRNFADATRWFRTYLSEQPQGSLTREALGRLMEALQRSGDTDGAHRVAQSYLEKYPSGSHAALARRLAAE